MKFFDRPVPHEEGKRRFEQIKELLNQENIPKPDEEDDSDTRNLLKKLPPVDPDDPMHKRKDLDY